MLGERPFLISLGQPNVAMPMAMNVYEHCPPDEKGILMDSGMPALRHASQRQDLLSQFLI